MKPCRSTCYTISSRKTLAYLNLYVASNTSYLLFTPINPNPSILYDDSSSQFSFYRSIEASTLKRFSGDPRIFHSDHTPPIKIFLYDLPRKFTYGVIESYLSTHNSLTKPGNNLSLKYLGNQHSVEWFLFSDLINLNRFNSHVVRVLDPEKEDLFYILFFSSLNLVVNPIRDVNFGSDGIYINEEMQEGLIEWLEGQVYWKRNLGRDHVFVCQDPNALYWVIDRVKNNMLLILDFERLEGVRHRL